MCIWYLHHLPHPFPRLLREQVRRHLDRLQRHPARADAALLGAKLGDLLPFPRRKHVRTVVEPARPLPL